MTVPDKIDVRCENVCFCIEGRFCLARSHMIFLRITPFFPNWLINIAAPVVEVPFFHFWLGTFIGVGPPSFVAIQTDKTLHEITAEEGSWSWNSIALLGVFAVFSLLPVYFKEKLAEKEAAKEE